MVDVSTKIIYEEEFVFTEDLFKQYYLLHLRPHEKNLSAKLLHVAVVMLIIWSLFVVPYFAWGANDPSSSIFSDPASWSDYQHLMANSLLLASAFFCVGAPAAVYGIRLLRGRRPNWNRTRWKIRIDQSFDAIKTKRNNSPFDSGIETEASFLEILLVLWPHRYEDTWANNDRYVTFIWNTSHYSNLPSCEPYAVPFAVRIYSDHIERGSKDSDYAVVYDDIYDILEHKRFPDVAILRSEEYGETVVLKDGFEGASWDEVKAYIEKRIMEAKRVKRTNRNQRMKRWIKH